MTVYIAAIGEGVERAIEHKNVEKVRTYTNMWGERVAVLTLKGGEDHLSLLLSCVDMWIV